MRALLDTNILIHREARTVVREDIGELFRWLDRLGYVKCVHPLSREEINKHADADVVRSLKIKIGSYEVLKTKAPDSASITALRARDVTPNDHIDTSLLAELAADRVDVLITEDRGLRRKAEAIGLGARAFTIETFLEQASRENPALADYGVLAVRKELFGNIELRDAFFDSFREDYPGFDKWFNKKADESAYVCAAPDGHILAFLYLKRELPGEDYSDISPAFARADRLKIGTFKVIANGFRLGERFLKIVFDNALNLAVSEIYVTIFEGRPEQQRLIQLLEEWGFLRHGIKRGAAASEVVLVRDFSQRADRHDPRRSYPFVSRASRKFIVPIWPSYHTELLPDSILRTEAPELYADNKPNRNAISKVYVSRSIERELHPGDLIVFYRTGSGTAPAHHTAVATTLGVVQLVVDKIPNEASFIEFCRGRTVFTDEELAAQWNWKPMARPFLVFFLYLSTFGKKPNLAQLKSAGVLASHPRGFEQLSDEAFSELLTLANVDTRSLVP